MVAVETCPPAASEMRSRFRGWIDCLLDPTRAPIDQRQAAHEWCQWGLSRLGIDEHDVLRLRDPFFTDTRLATGKAISPLGAARCIREYRRTAVFLQALERAIESALLRFPNETLHVVEAGCGPLAPLALAFATRYPSERVVFTLLDLHPSAIEGARRIAEALGVTGSLRACMVGDAATLRFQISERPHIMVCEVLLRALTKEPQVAVTRNLAPQLRLGGFFLPQRIEVDAGLLLSSCDAWSQSDASGRPFTGALLSRVSEIGRAFLLDAATAHQLMPDDAGRFKGELLQVPAHDRTGTPLRLFTRIQVFGDHRLGDYDSSLNLPERVNYPDELADLGGKLRFAYETSGYPGLRLDLVTPECPAKMIH
jgi:SAM-dependent methyltransferase